ncbi:transglycosylase [Intrasporangium oryzae NRRL B-24470]|uniref:Transglycosylase n=2 Tax=Intrasporangium TaxID=53357 RepID=W9GCK9_9MICO|nr:transglycosylase [Intrasporangium oryzae NRRL B-24470]
MITRNLKVMSVAGAALVLTAGGVTAAQLDKSVHLSVDGKASDAHVFGSTVGDLLDSQGISVHSGDVVIPAVDDALSDGETVTVKYARTLTVTIDGKVRQIRTTETTVDGALLALGLRGDGDRISVSRSQTIGRQGLSLSIVTPKSVTVVADGKTTTKTLTAATVGEALTQLRVQVGASDKVSPAATAPLTAGTRIVVQRVATKDAKVTRAIPFPTVRTETSTLYKGQTKIKTAGVAGVRAVTVRTTVVDGKVVSTTDVASTVTKAPVTQVVLVGTKARPATTSTTSSTSTASGGSLNLANAAMWDRVASCESGGNWHINTGNGYYGGLQFSASTWLAYGGGQFASRADLASREQQITVANRVYADNGLAQWGCKG